MEFFAIISILLFISFFMHGLLDQKIKNKMKFSEDSRQVVHMSIGIVVILIAYFIGVDSAKVLILAGIFFGMIICTLRAMKIRIRIIEKSLHLLERPKVETGYGAFAYFSGMLFCLSCFEFTIGMSLLYILCIGDSVATIIGKRYGKTKLIYNRSKSLEGLFAFLFFSLPVVYFAGAQMVTVVIIASILETIDIGVDDNVLIPLAGFVYGFA
jgi:dolichol kinase